MGGIGDCRSCNRREPWFGYELGYWSDEEREEADLALAGKHYEVGERAEKNRTQIVIAQL